MCPKRTTCILLSLLLPLLAANAANAQEPPALEPGSDQPLGQVIQTFYLEDARPADVLTAVRRMAGIESVVTNEALGAVTLRDTPEKMAVAERIIRAHDRARAEVVVNVELLEFEIARLLDLGEQFSDGIPLRLAAADYARLKQAGGAALLANPKLNIVAGHRGQLKIGDRLPISTGGEEGAVSYQDVGFGLQIEPRVHSGSEEITLEIAMEVSSVTDPDASGRHQPIVGTRELKSSVRLRDGETYFLAGLIHTGARKAAGGARLDSVVSGPFTTAKAGQSEVVLALTPHLVRRLDPAHAAGQPIWVGTEANLRLRAGGEQVASKE